MDNNLDNFIEQNNITIDSVKKVDCNPSMDSNVQMNHYLVTLDREAKKGEYKRPKFTLHYSKGIGHKGKKPTAKEVMECLHSDISCVDGYSFDDFCDALGYDTDSRKALALYLTLQEQQTKIRQWLGSEYQAFLECEPE